MLVTDALLQREPWTLPGLSVRVQTRLKQIAHREISWALCCDGLPEPTTLAALLKWRPAALLSFPNFGRGSLDNLEAVLQRNNLTLSAERMWA